MKLTKEIYNIIDSCDKSYDDKFLYGVTSTHIFCRPSCKSRTPKYENIVLFKDETEALSSNFRPCKRCKPLGKIVPDELWVNTIKEYIGKNYKKKLTLLMIADACHGSPYHLFRIFKKHENKSPFEYQTELRLNNSLKLLDENILSIKEISEEIGIKSSAQFIALFKKKYQLTPNMYRKGRKDESN